MAVTTKCQQPTARELSKLMSDHAWLAWKVFMKSAKPVTPSSGMAL
jgi:hypothetical protein